MGLPFVSRARFEDVRLRVEQLEAERKRLLDRIALLTGQPPLYTERAAGVTTIATPPARRTDPEPKRDGPINRRRLLAMANQDAAARARTPGAPGVVAQMHSKEAHLRQARMPAVVAEFQQAEQAGRERAVTHAG